MITTFSRPPLSSNMLFPRTTYTSIYSLAHMHTLTSNIRIRASQARRPRKQKPHPTRIAPNPSKTRQKRVAGGVEKTPTNPPPSHIHLCSINSYNHAQKMFHLFHPSILFTLHSISALMRHITDQLIVQCPPRVYT